jgi:hypothetical protein
VLHKAAIWIPTRLKVAELVFGSETGDIISVDPSHME